MKSALTTTKNNRVRKDTQRARSLFMASLLPTILLMNAPARADVLPPGSTVEGKTIGEWTADFWNRTHAFGSQSPFADRTGRLATQRQDEPVFFVNYYTTPGARTFEVPADKHILVSLNAVTYIRSANEPPQQIEQIVHDVMDTTTELNFSLDGVSVPENELFRHREESGFYTDTIPRNSWTGEPAGAWTNSFAEGYFVMLEPLSPGTHELKYGGFDTFFGFRWDSTSILTVVGETVVGDYDGSGVLDIADVNTLVWEIAAGTNNVEYDITNDNLVNKEDLTKWVKELKHTWFGDVNLDGEFNSGDLVAVFKESTFEMDVEAAWNSGDWNGDHRFDTGDLVAAFKDGGFELGPRALVASVPEPSGAVLLLLGSVAALWRRSPSV